MSARPLMILGTASHVGKSLITAGLCRIFADEGLRVAPFKAQNMSLNSATTPDGREIGRAQALQAEACRLMPTVEMNPILIKPHSDTSSQIVLLGRVWGQVDASNYHNRTVDELFPVVLESYRKLASEFDLVLLEGAGSAAEVNLRDHDIVNLQMAKMANAACLLVGDIDRGGVFASLLGTMELLEPAERKMFKGFLINKFRGDLSLLQPGIEAMERRLGLPCIGVVPHLPALGLDEEDSVVLEDRLSVHHTWDAIDPDDSPHRRLRVGVIAFPYMANFTDFDALAAEPSVALAFVERAEDVTRADVLILPGTKQTIADLDWLTRHGFAPKLRERHAHGRLTIGICGGFQMLGLSLEDPWGVENNGVAKERPGLGLLAVRTVFNREKITRPVRACLYDPFFALDSWKVRVFEGYEIHMGETQRSPTVRPLATLFMKDNLEILDGAIDSAGLVLGTYLHGFFDNDSFRHSFLDWARASQNLSSLKEVAFVTAEREARLNRWADHLRHSLRLDLIRSWIHASPEALTY